MKRFALVASASLALLVGACDDDDSPTKKDAGSDAKLDTGSEAGAEGGVPGMCVGTFAVYNRTSLGAAAAARPAGKCKAAADLDLVCTQDISGRIRSEHAKPCLAAPGGNEAIVSCIAAGVKRDFMTLSDACLSCYTDSVICTLEKCLVACSTDAASPACLMCQLNMGCTAAFFTCSGLPGGPPAGDGGTPDTAPDTAGTTDAPVDAGVDTAVDSASDAGSDV